jgi:hypothetical protein
MIFDKFSKIIAIKDSPVIDSSQFGKRIQAYKTGDVFEVMSSFSDQVVVWHPKIESTMAMNSDNFVLLSEWRNDKIEKLILNGGSERV